MPWVAYICQRPRKSTIWMKWGDHEEVQYFIQIFIKIYSRHQYINAPTTEKGGNHSPNQEGLLEYSQTESIALNVKRQTE